MVTRDAIIKLVLTVLGNSKPPFTNQMMTSRDMLLKCHVDDHLIRDLHSCGLSYKEIVFTLDERVDYKYVVQTIKPKPNSCKGIDTSKLVKPFML